MRKLLTIFTLLVVLVAISFLGCSSKALIPEMNKPQISTPTISKLTVEAVALNLTGIYKHGESIGDAQINFVDNSTLERTIVGNIESKTMFKYEIIDGGRKIYLLNLNSPDRSEYILDFRYNTDEIVIDNVEFWSEQYLAKLKFESIISTPEPTPSEDENLRNPTYDELIMFLWNDQTDKMHDYYDVAKKLQQNAKGAGWRCAYVVVGIDSSFRAINAFETTDRGLIYIYTPVGSMDIESTNEYGWTNHRIVNNDDNKDTIVDVRIGNDFIPKRLFAGMEQSGARWEFLSQGIVTSIEISW